MPNDGMDADDDGVHDTLHSAPGIRRDLLCGGERDYQSYGRYSEDLVWGRRTGDGVNDRFTLKAAGMDTEING